jgi:hypothetical protein
VGRSFGKREGRKGKRDVGDRSQCTALRVGPCNYRLACTNHANAQALQSMKSLQASAKQNTGSEDGKQPGGTHAQAAQHEDYELRRGTTNCKRSGSHSMQLPQASAEHNIRSGKQVERQMRLSSGSAVAATHYESPFSEAALRTTYDKRLYHRRRELTAA